MSPDADDAEYVLLKKKVMSKVAKKEGDVSLVQVTKAAMQAINDDIEKLISLTVDPKTADYAVITGVQIHSGNQVSTDTMQGRKLLNATENPRILLRQVLTRKYAYHLTDIFKYIN